MSWVEERLAAARAHSAVAANSSDAQSQVGRRLTRAAAILSTLRLRAPHVLTRPATAGGGGGAGAGAGPRPSSATGGGERPSSAHSNDGGDGAAVHRAARRHGADATDEFGATRAAAADAKKGPGSEKGVLPFGNAVDPVLIREQQRLERITLLTRQQCALGLCFLATGVTGESVNQVDGVLRALKALSTFGRDGDAVRLRVAIALHALSRSKPVAEIMAREGVVPVLVRFASSRSDLVRREVRGWWEFGGRCFPPWGCMCWMHMGANGA